MLMLVGSNEERRDGFEEMIFPFSQQKK